MTQVSIQYASYLIEWMVARVSNMMQMLPYIDISEMEDHNDARIVTCDSP